MRRDVYTHGHHESVLRSHSRRTAENSAAYLLPYLRSGQRLLDVGCGPGTVTVGLAERVAPGEVIGIDPVEAVLAEARRHAGERLGPGVGEVAPRVEFRSGDVYGLDFEDDAFDVVNAHQVLQHLTDPVAALREMRRVTRPGGVVAARDGDYGAFAWYPESAGLERWRELYRRVTAANGAQADAGRRLLSWALQAGFTHVTPSADVWCFATPEDRAWWSETWAERAIHSDFAAQAVAYDLATEDDLRSISEAWLEWGAADDGWFGVLHGELIARA